MSFVEIDRELLAERWDVTPWEQPGRGASPLAVARAVRRADVVFGWFASWHTFLPITLARILRKPSVLVVGGFDTANMPEIGYGYQRGGAQKWLSRSVMRQAGRLITNSEASRREIERNVGLPADRVTVVYHGLADRFGDVPLEREPRVLTVGAVARISLDRKGFRTFVQAAALLPDVPFVVVGEWQDDAIDELRRIAPPNVEFTGRVPRERLDEEFARASVYVQASRHEGFGLALAEAMLAGCIPVVTRAGALPEVVGETGVQVGFGADAVADGIRHALALPPEERIRARERVLREFPLERRRAGLVSVVEAAARRR